MKKILNILLGIMMVITAVLLVYAMATGETPESVIPAISLNLVWLYILLFIAIAAVILCAVIGMLKNPAGIKGTIISLVLMVIIIGISYFYSAGHTVNITDVQTNGFFGRPETVITETSILVTYVAFIAAFIAAIATEIWAAFK